MAITLNGSSQYLHLGSAPAVVTYPFTMAVWMKPVDHSAIFTLSSIEGGGDYHILQACGTTNNCAAGSYQTKWAYAYSTADFANGTWQHVCGVFTSAKSQACFLNGTNKGTNATSQTPVGLVEFLVGARNIGSPTNFFYGKIAYVALWNVALSDEEVAVLAAGADPALIQSANLVGCYPLYNDPTDTQGGSSLVAVGSPTYDTVDTPTLGEVAPTSVTISGVTDVYAGYKIALTAVPMYGSGNYTYQWNKEGSPIPGATSSVYTKEATIDDSGHYTVTVSNGGGSTTSSIVTVTVSSATVAFVTVGQPSATGKTVFAYNEAGVLLWEYATASSALYVVKFDDAGRIVVGGTAADNGDGHGTRTIWRLAQDGSYIDGTATPTVVRDLSIQGGVIMTIGGGDDVYWLREDDYYVLDQDYQTSSGGFACLLSTDGNSWYSYLYAVTGPDYYYIRELDVNRDEVFAAYKQSDDSYVIRSLKETSTGKVIAFSPEMSYVVSHTTGGAGGFDGDWATAMPGWVGFTNIYGAGLYVDQNDSNKIYCVGDRFGVLNASGDVLYNVDKPSRGRMVTVGPYGEAGKVLVVTQRQDGGNLYVWHEDLGELQCVKDLLGPDINDFMYGLAVAPSVSWNFPATEELDSHEVSDTTENVTGTVWIAETFTLTDYKKPGRVSVWMSRSYTTETLVVSIQAVDGDGKPDGVDICSGTYVSVNAGPDTTQYMTHIFFTTTPILNPGTYAIVVRTLGGDLTLDVDSADGHSGTFWTSTDSGSTWTSASKSLKFELWGDISGYVLPSFDAQSGNQNLYIDQTPTPLSVTVSGNPTPTLQWYADGSPIPGETGSTYAPPAQSEATSISYVCRATNLLGYTDSIPMVITWSELPLPADPTRYNILNMQLDLGTRV